MTDSLGVTSSYARRRTPDNVDDAIRKTRERLRRSAMMTKLSLEEDASLLEVEDKMDGEMRRRAKEDAIARGHSTARRRAAQHLERIRRERELAEMTVPVKPRMKMPSEPRHASKGRFRAQDRVAEIRDREQRRRASAVAERVSEKEAEARAAEYQRLAKKRLADEALRRKLQEVQMVQDLVNLQPSSSHSFQVARHLDPLHARRNKLKNGKAFRPSPEKEARLLLRQQALAKNTHKAASMTRADEERLRRILGPIG